MDDSILTTVLQTAGFENLLINRALPPGVLRVLDDCEHLGEACALVVDRMLLVAVKTGRATGALLALHAPLVARETMIQAVKTGRAEGVAADVRPCWWWSARPSTFGRNVRAAKPCSAGQCECWIRQGRPRRPSSRATIQTWAMPIA
jgi:hypothetical protein